jgi:hypothetical protein
MTSTTTFSYNAVNYDFTVSLWGGANEDAVERDDPFPSDDRGYFFDGCE